MVRKSTAEDIAYVAMNIREADGAEIEAATGMSLPDALKSLDATPNITLTLWKGDRPVAIFGALLVNPGEALMFRFATPLWSRAVRDAIKFGRREFLPKLWHAGVKRVEAVTLDLPDQTAWLRVFGAKETEKFLRNGQKFVRFALDRPA